MKELIKLGDKTYVFKNPVNIGIYLLDENNVCLIDSGNSKDSAKLVEKVLIENNWNLKYIINTHSHADHIGGNKYFQSKYNIKIYASKVESYFINTPILEPAFLYGANPLKELHNHFLLASPSNCESLEEGDIPGISVIDLKGHSYANIGIVTSDNVCFVGDAYTSAKILEKYTLQYVYDVQNYLESLNFLKTTSYNYYVPSHGDVEENPDHTIETNIATTKVILNEIINMIGSQSKFNDLTNKIFTKYHLKSNSIQYHLITTTLKAYLSYLEDTGKVTITFEDANMLIIKNENN